MPEVIPALTSLRFFAALTIVLFHLQTVYKYDIGLNAGSAVSLFFVLSGFVLTLRYPKFENRKAIRDFYLARFMRLWPLQIATLLFFLIALYPTRDYYLLVQHVLLIQAWFADTLRAMSFNGVAWTISNEAFFYLLFPLVILTRRHLAIWFAGASLVVATAIVIGNGYGLGEPMQPGSDWASAVHTWPPIRFLEFLGGAGAAMLIVRLAPRLDLSVASWTLLELVALSMAAVTSIPAIGFIGLWLWLGPVGHYWSIYSAMFPAMAFLIAVLAVSRGLLASLLSLRVLVFLGEISFSTYLWHQLIYLVWLREGWTQMSLAHYGTLIATIYAVSIVSFYLVEKPPMRLLRWYRARARRGDTACGVGVAEIRPS